MMGILKILQRLRLGKIIFLLVFLLIILQIFHMSLLTRLEAKEAQNKGKMTIGRQLKGRLFKEIADEMEDKIRNAHRLDYGGMYNVIDNLLLPDGEESSDKTKDVTVVTQCSSNHLHHLLELSQRWDGPISVTVFTYETDIGTAMYNIARLHLCNEQVHKSTLFHLVYPLNRAQNRVENDWKLKVSCDKEMAMGKTNFKDNYALEGIEYPHNLLRNLAIKYSRTSFVFMIDIDMVPSANLHSAFQKLLQTTLKSTDNFTSAERIAFVVPAFEVRKDVNIPSNKAELVQEWGQGNVRPFYKNACWKCQRHTGYDRWRNLQQTTSLEVAYQLEWKDPWEPFFMGGNSLPLYDERFKQYGFNRISQVCEMHIAGFQFAVLNNAFLVHKGFKEAGTFHETKEAELNKNRLLFRRFKEELKVKYPDVTRRCY